MGDLTWGASLIGVAAFMFAGVWWLRHAAISEAVLRWSVACLDLFGRIGSAYAKHAAGVLRTQVDPAAVTLLQLLAVARLVAWYFSRPAAALLLLSAALLYARSLARRYSGAMSYEGLLRHNRAWFASIAPAVHAGLKAEHRTKGPWAAAMSYGTFALHYDLVKGPREFLPEIEAVLTEARELKLKGEADRLRHLLLGRLETVKTLLGGLEVARASRAMQRLAEELEPSGPLKDMAGRLAALAQVARRLPLAVDEDALVKVLLWQLGEWSSDPEHPGEPAPKPGTPEGRFESIEALAAAPLRRAEYGLMASFAAACTGDKRGAELLMRMSLSFREGGHGRVRLDVRGAEAILKDHGAIIEETARSHAYVVTVLMGLLKRARTQGVLPAIEFRWVRPMEYWRLEGEPRDGIVCRRLWHALRAVGSRVVSVEAMGPFAHFQAEIAAGEALVAARSPEFWTRPIDAFRQCLEREGYLDPAYEEKEAWKKQ